MKTFTLLLCGLTLTACATVPGHPAQTKAVESYDQVEPTMLAHKDDFQACYKKGDTTKSGIVKVALAIGSDGKVAQAGVQESTLNQAVVEGCILDTLQGIQFPPPPSGDTVEASYPIEFKSK